MLPGWGRIGSHSSRLLIFSPFPQPRSLKTGSRARLAPPGLWGCSCPPSSDEITFFFFFFFPWQPFGEWCNLQPKDAAKMPESAWKLLFYSLSWSYGAYLLFCTDYPFFHDPPSVFYGEEKTGGNPEISLFFSSRPGCREGKRGCLSVSFSLWVAAGGAGEVNQETIK